MKLRLCSAYLRRLLAAVFCWPLLVVAAPEVVVSIKPVHSLIAGVMAGVGAPELLIRSRQTPHDISLTPSDVRKLSRADRVFWVGQALESPMAKIVRTTVAESRSVALLSVSGMETLEIRESGLWESPSPGGNSHAHGGHAAAVQEQGREEIHKQKVDPHIWLSPFNASRIVRLATAELSLVDPQNADIYRHNSEAVLERIHTLDLAIAKRLSAVSEVPYIVFHDAYAYFERHYRLNAVGSLSISPERSPGVRRIQQLRATIKALNIRCVFSEPQFEPGLMPALLEGSEARSGRLDPLGADLPAGPDAYFLMMNNLADALVDCLEPVIRH